MLQEDAGVAQLMGVWGWRDDYTTGETLGCERSKGDLRRCDIRLEATACSVDCLVPTAFQTVSYIHNEDCSRTHSLRRLDMSSRPTEHHWQQRGNNVRR